MSDGFVTGVPVQEQPSQAELVQEAFHVTIPAGVLPGGAFLARSPCGTMYNVKVPPSAIPGSLILVATGVGVGAQVEEFGTILPPNGGSELRRRAVTSPARVRPAPGGVSPQVNRGAAASAGAASASSLTAASQVELRPPADDDDDEALESDAESDGLPENELGYAAAARPRMRDPLSFHPVSLCFREPELESDYVALNFSKHFYPTTIGCTFAAAVTASSMNSVSTCASYRMVIAIDLIFFALGRARCQAMVDRAATPAPATPSNGRESEGQYSIRAAACTQWILTTYVFATVANLAT